MAIAATIGLQFAAVYTPIRQQTLHTAPLRGSDWVLIFAVAVPVFLVAETLKHRMAGDRGSIPSATDSATDSDAV